MRGYYSKHSEEYIASTIRADMSAIYALFEPRLKGKRILDVGFGSGRDMVYFQSKGYEVYGIDTESSFVRHALKTGLNVTQADVRTYETNQKFDGIWACASLLHLSKKDMVQAMERLKGMLETSGVLFVSLKEGDSETVDEKGRLMTFVDSDFLEELGFKVLSITDDSDGRGFRWLNAIYQKA